MIGLILPVLVFALFSGTGCNGTAHTPVQPTPTATSSSVPVTPSPSPTVTPSPSPTTSPSPNPSPSPSPKPTGLYDGPEEVRLFVEKFVSDGSIQGVNVTPDMKNPKLTIQFGDLSTYGSYTIGLCELSDTMRRVTLSSRFWNSVEDTQKELLLHHELGHCVLYRAHRTDKFSDGTPKSIMYPVIMGSDTYKNAYSYYQNELFTFKGELSQGLGVISCNSDELED